MPIRTKPGYARRGEGRSPRPALVVNDDSGKYYQGVPYQQAGFKHLMQMGYSPSQMLAVHVRPPPGLRHEIVIPCTLPAPIHSDVTISLPPSTRSTRLRCESGRPRAETQAELRISASEPGDGDPAVWVVTAKRTAK
jgi:hypothetical protein